MVRFYRGCDLLLFAEVKNDTKDLYSTEKPERLEALCSVSLPASRTVTIIYKDGEPFNLVGQRNDATISIKIPSLDEKLRAYLLGEKSDGDYFIDTGKTGTPFFALGFRLKNSDETYKYYWFNKGVFSFNARSVNTEQGTETAQEELVYTPILTNKLFNGKPCKSVSVDSFTITHEINEKTWSNQVWTPEAFFSVASPIIYPESDSVEVGELITITGTDEINYKVVVE